jgi:hypothetical protein
MTGKGVMANQMRGKYRQHMRVADSQSAHSTVLRWKTGSATDPSRNDLSFSGTVFHGTDAKIPHIN